MAAPVFQNSSSLVVSRATSAETFAKIRDLRYRVYCEELRAYPEGWEPCDSYDAHAEQFHASLDGRVIAAARLIRSAEGRFPMSQDYGFPLPAGIPNGNLLEFSRWIVDPGFRKRRMQASPKHSGVGGTHVGLGIRLIRETLAWTLAQGSYTHWITMMSPDGFRLYDRLSWPAHELAAPRMFHGMEFRALLIPLEKIPHPDFSANL